MDSNQKEAHQESGTRWWMRADTFDQFGPLRGVRIEKCQYLGGWQGQTKARGDILEIGAGGFFFTVQGFEPTVVIPWERVRGLSVSGPDSAARPTVTAGRAAKAWATSGYGLFSLLAKEKSALLVISTDLGTEVVFQTTAYLWHELRSMLEPILAHYPEASSLPSTPVADTAPPVGPGGSPVAAQIRELAELRDAGILSEAEFQAKKTDLLGRI